MRMKKLSRILPVGFLKDRVKSLKETGLPKGYYTGISNLDDVFRLDKGRLVTVTGVPNCGKSEFVDFYVSVLNKKYGLKTLFFSPENQPYELHLSKLISKYANMPFDKISDAEISKITDYLCQNFFFFNYEKVKSLKDIEDAIEKQIQETPFDVLVLDAYNKIEVEKSKDEIETEFISKILDKLCETAIKYNIIIILVAHPRKMEWNKSDKVAQCPTAYDINGSANFYNKSDYVLAVHRDRQKDEVVTIRVDKVKFNHYGTQGTCRLKYDVNSGNYYNSSKYDEDVYIPIEFEIPEQVKRNNPLDVMVTFYNNVTDKVGKDVCLKDCILTDGYKEIANRIRVGKTEEERHKKKEELKLNIPTVTVSGSFTNRTADGLKTSSGLIAIDIDYKDNVEIMPQVREILSNLEYVAYCGKSISGDGYFAIIPIENPQHFKQHFYALEEEMATYGIVIDKACKDVSRLRYVSYDDNYYYNPDASTYYWEIDEVSTKSKQVKEKRKKYTVTSTKSDKDIVKEELSFLKNRNISIPDDYNTWFTTAMSLNSAFGEEGRTFFHEFSKLSDKYNETECNDQYDKIVSKYDENSDIKLGSLFHIIRETKDKYNKLNK